MSRKTIILIVTGALVAALVAAVGIVSYHVGFNHGNVGVMRIGSSQRGMMCNLVVGGGFARRDAGFPALGLLAAVLLAGAVGAAIVYLIGPGRNPDGALAVGAAGAGATGAGAGAATPSASGPIDPLWQQFEQWYRQTHGGTAAVQAPVAVQAPAGVQEQAVTQAQAATQPPAMTFAGASPDAPTIATPSQVEPPPSAPIPPQAAAPAGIPMQPPASAPPDSEGGSAT